MPLEQPLEQRDRRLTEHSDAKSGALASSGSQGSLWFNVDQHSKRPSGRPRVQVHPEEISYAVVIDACAQKGDARGAAAWLEEMLESPSGPNAFAFNAVIAGFARKGSAEEAAGWLDKMKTQGITPNVVSYTAVIDGCAKAGDPKGAVRWFETMCENSVTPNELSYNAVINSFARVGDSSSACAWLDRMRSWTDPDEISYSSAIHGCATAQPPDSAEAERLFRAMVAEGLQPTASTLSALTSAVGSFRRDELCVSVGVDVKKAMQHRPPPQHRKVDPASAAGGRGRH